MFVSCAKQETAMIFTPMESVYQPALIVEKEIKPIEIDTLRDLKLYTNPTEVIQVIILENYKKEK